MKTSDKAMLAMVIMTCLVAAGCGPAVRQDSSAAGTDSLADLPRLRQRGTDYPYTRYSESSGQTASRGRAIFLYPIREAKTEILALEYSPGTKVEDLFGEELLGRSGEIISDQGHIRIEFLPISIPVGVAPGQQWRMRHAKREFACGSRAVAAVPGTGQISVSCTAGQYTLNFTFDRTRGVTEFQDFCDFAICNFKLMDPHGLLSSRMTKYMGLPNI